MRGVFCAIEAELLPICAQSCRRVSEVEEGEVFGVAAIAWLANGSTPDASILKGGPERGCVDGAAVGGVLIDEEDGLVGEKRARDVGVPRRVITS